VVRNPPAICAIGGALLEIGAMRNATLLLIPALALLSACAPTGGPLPSLQPRAAEAIDPRVPVVRPINDRPASPALKVQLAELVGRARNGNATFEPIVSRAENLAAAAGGSRSESWVAAQEALSAAVAARQPTARALGDIDALAANALQTRGGIAPNDLAAIQSAATEVAALDQRQADRIAAIQRRLGL
jgi:hypothetical protein